MWKVLFVCHGNICRSPMAEAVFRDMVRKEGLEDRFEIASAATSTEELGNPPHYGTRAELKKYNISCGNKHAVLLKASDYGRYDMILGMDRENIWNMHRIFNGDPEHKVHLLKDFSDGGEVDDPWYSGDFHKTYVDISIACEKLLAYMKKHMK